MTTSKDDKADKIDESSEDINEVMDANSSNGVAVESNNVTTVDTVGDGDSNNEEVDAGAISDKETEANEQADPGSDEVWGINASNDTESAFEPVSPQSSISSSSDEQSFHVESTSKPTIDNTQNDDITDKYRSRDRYVGAASRSKKSNKKTRILLVLIAVFFAIAAMSAVALAVIFNTDAFVNDAVSNVTEDKWGISSADEEMLLAEGYDGEQLTDDVKRFCETFFTFDKDSVDDGTWKKSFDNFIAPESELVKIQENLIYIRTQKGAFDEVFSQHPYFLSKTVSCNRIAWYMLPTQTVNVPYCDVYVTIDRCPIDHYSLNAPSFTINRYLDRYRIVFNANGEITSCKKMSGNLLEEGVEQNAMAADNAVYDKLIADAEKKAEAKRRQAAEERARATAKAQEEAQKAKEAEEKAKAEEEAKQKAEQEAAQNASNNSSTNTNTNNPSSSSNQNSSSGSSSNSNSSSNTSAPGGDSSGGSSGGGSSNSNAAGQPATQSTD